LERAEDGSTGVTPSNHTTQQQLAEQQGATNPVNHLQLMDHWMQIELIAS